MSVEEYVYSLSLDEVWRIVENDGKIRSIDSIAVLLEVEKCFAKDFARQAAGKLLLRCLRGE